MIINHTFIEFNFFFRHHSILPLLQHRLIFLISQKIFWICPLNRRYLGICLRLCKDLRLQFWFVQIWFGNIDIQIQIHFAPQSFSFLFKCLISFQHIWAISYPFYCWSRRFSSFYFYIFTCFWSFVFLLLFSNIKWLKFCLLLYQKSLQLKINSCRHFICRCRRAAFSPTGCTFDCVVIHSAYFNWLNCLFFDCVTIFMYIFQNQIVKRYEFLLLFTYLTKCIYFLCLYHRCLQITWGLCPLLKLVNS